MPLPQPQTWVSGALGEQPRAQKPGPASRPFPTLDRVPQIVCVGGLPSPSAVACPLMVRGGTSCTQAPAPDAQTLLLLLQPRLSI